MQHGFMPRSTRRPAAGLVGFVFAQGEVGEMLPAGDASKPWVATRADSLLVCVVIFPQNALQRGFSGAMLTP